MVKNPEKKEGNSGPCFRCGNTIYCNMTKYKDKDNYLQWQNQDGKAHYNKDGECKQIVQKVEETQQKVDAEMFPLKDIKLDMGLITDIQKITTNATNIQKMVYRTICESCPNAPPAVIGMFFNQQCDKLFGSKDLATILSDLGGNNE